MSWDWRLFRRSFTDATKIVIGGVTAGAVFSFLSEFGFPELSSSIGRLLFGIGVVLVFILIILLALMIYLIESQAPNPMVNLTDGELDEIADRVSNRLEDQNHDARELEKEER